MMASPMSTLAEEHEDASDQEKKKPNDTPRIQAIQCQRRRTARETRTTTHTKITTEIRIGARSQYAPGIPVGMPQKRPETNSRSRGSNAKPTINQGRRPKVCRGAETTQPDSGLPRVRVSGHPLPSLTTPGVRGTLAVKDAAKRASFMPRAERSGVRAKRGFPSNDLLAGAARRTQAFDNSRCRWRGAQRRANGPSSADHTRRGWGSAGMRC